LKGVDTGILEEPSFAIYVRDYHPPDPALESVPGRWRWEDGWPIDRTDQQNWNLQANRRLSIEARQVQCIP
jgi:hypothetical protein